MRRDSQKKLGYIRVSTHQQIVDRQLMALEDYCDQVFVEDGVSAVSKHRPVYDDVMSKLNDNDMFVVSSLDRAFRSVQDALSELDRLQDIGVEFRSLSQNFDTTTPDGKFLYTLAAALAAWEREILSQRTKEGMLAAKRKGKHVGRPPKLSAQDIQKSRDLLAQNHHASIADMARALDVHEKTLRRALDSA